MVRIRVQALACKNADFNLRSLQRAEVKKHTRAYTHTCACIAQKVSLNLFDVSLSSVYTYMHSSDTVTGWYQYQHQPHAHKLMHVCMC